MTWLNNWVSLSLAMNLSVNLILSWDIGVYPYMLLGSYFKSLQTWEHLIIPFLHPKSWCYCRPCGKNHCVDCVERTTVQTVWREPLSRLCEENHCPDCVERTTVCTVLREPPPRLYREKYYAECVDHVDRSTMQTVGRTTRTDKKPGKDTINIQCLSIQLPFLDFTTHWLSPYN